MRFFAYSLLVFLGLSCSGMNKKPLPEERTVSTDTDSGTSKNVSSQEQSIFPDTELKQVIIRGSYYPRDPERVTKKEAILRRGGHLKEGETLKEKFPRMFNNTTGKEGFIYINERYCYNKVEITDRGHPYSEDLRVRLYDQKGKMIGEDFLRLATSKQYSIELQDEILGLQPVNAYIPYNENSHEIRIVRLEGTKEIIIFSFSHTHPSKSLFIQYYRPNPNTNARYSIYSYGDRYLYRYEYDSEAQCHISPLKNTD